MKRRTRISQLAASPFKNEYTKRALRMTGLRKSAPEEKRRTAHYRMPALESDGYLALRGYDGPEIPPVQWEGLDYKPSTFDPHTYIAPITSPTGFVELVSAKEVDKQDLDCAWTANAQSCPAIVAWLESVGAPFGLVQVLRMERNTLRECRWGLHRDENNAANPERNGWIVRVLLELTDDPSSALVLRRKEFDRPGEVAIPLPKYQQLVVDSEVLWHGVHHRGPGPRYALVVNFESGRALERWLQRPPPRS